MVVPAMRAAVTANSAALAQTQRELAVYRWPAWPVQDALRRTPIVDAASLVEEYRQALALAPNASASMRLGQIELSLGDYESARAHLAAAYETAPSRPAVRQLLGEALAITGDVDGAANLWRTLPLGADQLQIREGWYRLIDEPQLAARIHQAAARATAR
jgi:tetratricopeptide (TPR) repeat protein